MEYLGKIIEKHDFLLEGKAKKSEYADPHF